MPWPFALQDQQSHMVLGHTQHQHQSLLLTMLAIHGLLLHTLPLHGLEHHGELPHGELLHTLTLLLHGLTKLLFMLQLLSMLQSVMLPHTPLLTVDQFTPLHYQDMPCHKLA